MTTQETILDIDTQIAKLQTKKKLVEAFGQLQEMFAKRNDFTVKTYSRELNLFEYGQLWHCGSLEKSGVAHLKEMYKLMHDEPMKNPELDKFQRAENFIHKQLRENRDETYDTIYSLLD